MFPNSISKKVKNLSDRIVDVCRNYNRIGSSINDRAVLSVVNFEKYRFRTQRQATEDQENLPDDAYPSDFPLTRMSNVSTANSALKRIKKKVSTSKHSINF